MDSPMSPAVLVVDADPDTARALCRSLEHEGFSTVVRPDDASAASVCATGTVHAVVLREAPGGPGADLSGYDGLVVVRIGPEGPTPEAVVEALGSRLGLKGRRLLRDDDLVIDMDSRSVTVGDRAIAMTTREFDLLAFLVGHPDRVHSRSRLLSAVWGWTIGDESTVTVHIRRIREKIETDPALPQRIITVWGTGYRYRAPV